MGRACSTNGSEEECTQDIGGKARRKETSRKTRRKWVDNIKIDLRDIACGGMDWIDLAQDMDQWRAHENVAINLRFPQTVGSFVECLHNRSFSRRAQLHTRILSCDRVYSDTKHSSLLAVMSGHGTMKIEAVCSSET
jgi:hypothetical protein